MVSMFHRTPADPVLQRHSLQKFHDDKGLAIFLADLMNGADIGVVQRGGGLRFTLEAGQCLGIFGNVVGQEFEGNEAVKI